MNSRLLRGSRTAISLAVLFLAGCGGGSVQTVTDVSGVASARAKHIYVANHDSDDVSAFSFNETTGALAAVPGNPLLRGWSGPRSGAIHPSGRFAYFANTASNNISAFSINAITGQLTPLATRFLVGVVAPISVTIDPSGQFAYVVSNEVVDSSQCRAHECSEIFAYSIDAIDGTLAPVGGSPFRPPTARGPFSAVTVHPSGRFAYMTDSSSHVFGFAVDPTTGALSLVLSEPVGEVFLTSVAIDPQGKFAYIGGRTFSSGPGFANRIYGFTFNSATGTLVPIGGPVIANSFGVSIDPQGKFLYDGVDVFAIGVTTGTLTNVTGSAQAAVGPGPVTFNSVSGLAYAASQGGVWAYGVNGATGAYSALTGSPFPAGESPTSVTIGPDGKFAYVTNSGSDSISVYDIDVVSGTPLLLAHGATGISNPDAMVIDPSRRFAYVATNRTASISQYSVEATGALGPSLIGPVSAGTSIVSVVVEPRGRFVYAVNDVPYDQVAGLKPPGNIFAYSVDAGTGALTAVPGSPFPTGKHPMAIAVDPGGNFAYVANYESEDVSSYRIDRTTGALESRGRIGVRWPQSVAVDPSGKFLFVAGLSGASVPNGLNDIGVLAIDAASGALSILFTNQGFSNFWPTGGQSPVAVAAEPSGRFVYVTNTGSNDVSAFAVDAGTGTLTAIGGSPFATGVRPTSLIADPSGKFLFVLHAGSPGQILTFSIAPNGTLSRLPDATTAGSGPVGFAVSW